MSNYKVSGTELTSIADAIREKGSTSAPLSFPDDFVSAIHDLPTSGAILVSKSITENGTYDPEDDDADGYSSVTVAVPNKCITGTFEGSSTDRGSSITVSIPYTGNGYPIAGIIYPSAGAWKSGSKLVTTVQKFAIIQWMFSKIDISTTPNYSANSEENQMEVLAEFKYSDSDAATTSTGKGHSIWNYHNTDASATYASPIKLKSATSMSVYIADTSYGFMDGVEYTYQVIYSA